MRWQRQRGSSGQRDRGITLYREDEFERAESVLRRATARNPDDRISWLYLARAQRNRGDLEGSLATIEKALVAGSEWPAGVWHAADLHIKLENYGGAQEALRLLVDLGRHKVDDLTRVGRLALEAGANDVATRIARHLVERQEMDGQAFAFIARTTATSGDAVLVRAIARKAIVDGDRALLGKSIQGTLAAGDQALCEELTAELAHAEPELAAAGGHFFADAGIRLFREGENEPARRALVAAVELNPDNRSGWLYLARAEQGVGDTAAAAKTLEAAVERHPNWPPTIRRAAELNLEAGDTERATQIIGSLEPRDGHESADLLRAGQLAIRIGATDTAVRIARYLAEREPNGAEIHILKAELAANQPVQPPRGVLEAARMLLPVETLAGARRDIDRVLGEISSVFRLSVETGTPGPQVDPRRQASSEADAGILSFREGDYERAREALAAAVDLDPDNRGAWWHLARTQRELGDEEAALRTLIAGIERDPNWPPAIRVAAELSFALGDQERAVEILSGLEPQEEHDIAELFRTAQAALRLGAVESAEDIAAFLRTHGAEDNEIQLLEGELALARGDEERALEIAAEANEGDRQRLLIGAIQTQLRLGNLERVKELAGEVDLDQTDGSAQPVARELREAGFEAFRSKEWDTAICVLRSAVRLHPDNKAAWLYLARSERDSGQLEDSLRTMHAALEIHPGWLAGILDLAEVERRLDRPTEARRVLNTVENLESRSHQDLLRLGRLALRVGATTLAHRVAKQLLERDADDQDALQMLAEAAIDAGDPSEALEVAETAARTGEEPLVASAVRIYLRLGRLERAFSVLDRCEITSPKYVLPVARDLRRAGFFSRALTLLAAAGTDDPRVPELERVISGAARIFVEHWRPESPTPKRVPPGPAERVLHIVGSSLPYRQSGYTVRTQQTALAQREVGMEPHVLTQFGFPASEQAPELAFIDAIPHHRMNGAGDSTLTMDHRLQASVDLGIPIVREVQPGLLHPASDFHNAIIAEGLRDATGIPFVYEVRGFWEETWMSRQAPGCDQSELYQGRRALELASMHAADQVVTLGETMKRHIIERGVAPEKVTIIPNGVDCDAFYPTARDPELAARLGIGPDATVVGCISSLVSYEGFEDLLRAVALLSERRQDVHCLLVGEGPERTRLAGLAEDLDIGDRVTFAGRVSHAEVREHYGLLDVVAMPRRPHRVCDLVTPLKPYEAMASGCALVVSQRAALMEIVEDEQTGVITDTTDTAGFAALLERLTEERDWRQQIANRALDWVRSERTWRRNAEAYRELYSRTVG